jgi:hypothetical protein
MKAYLGDSVYVEVDAAGLHLTTENGKENDPSNTIYLEAEVFTALVLYVMEQPELKEWRKQAVGEVLSRVTY